MKIYEDVIVAAAYVFERANGNLLDEFEQSEVVFHKLNDCDPELLASDIRTAILNDVECDRAQAYWALGKRLDPRLIPFFRERLAVELGDDLRTAFQIMVALDNLEEPVFSVARNGSYSILDSDMNRRDAEHYLSIVN